MTTGVPESGDEFGHQVLPNPWHKHLTVNSVVRVTGDSAATYLIDATTNDGFTYGSLRTDDNSKEALWFVPTPSTVAISGSIAGTTGVTVTIGSTPFTQSQYSAGSGTVGTPFTGSVTPSKTGYRFSPTSYAFSDIFLAKTSRDFTASVAVPYKPANPTPANGATNQRLNLTAFLWEAGTS
jgi:hypothetical protein